MSPARGAGRDAAAQERGIRLTLPPLYEEQLDENGLAGLISVSGAKVCVVKARPWETAWSAFVNTNGPCSISESDEPTVLDGVPRVAELLVTAEKDGYWPSVFAVTTDQWDLDTTRTPPTFSLHMRRKDAQWVSVPSTVTVSEKLGLIQVVAVACSFDGAVACRFVGGATTTLSPAQGEGPFYLIDGVLDPGATQTRAGARINQGARAPEDRFVDGPVTGASFVNVPEDEYQLTVTVPGLSCRVLGWAGDPIYGLAPNEGATIGVPVLAGHYTSSIAAICQCEWPSKLDVDGGVCVEDASDASTSG